MTTHICSFAVVLETNWYLSRYQPPGAAAPSTVRWRWSQAGPGRAEPHHSQPNNFLVIISPREEGKGSVSGEGVGRRWG